MFKFQENLVKLISQQITVMVLNSKYFLNHNHIVKMAKHSPYMTIIFILSICNSVLFYQKLAVVQKIH